MAMCCHMGYELTGMDKYPHLSGWWPALFSVYGVLGFYGNSVRSEIVKRKLDEFIPSDENKGLFNYPKMAMLREDIYEKTFSLEDQIQYFKCNEDELERRIMMLLESDSYYFTAETEIDMKARDIYIELGAIFSR